jgi:hypothetical protein
MSQRNISSSPELELDYLESHLAGTLKPVSPPNVVAQRLRGRIRFPQRSEVVMRFNDWRSLFMALGGALSGILLLITLARALYYLVGRRSA